ncbi:MAG: monofunctional biosynthetic peptidoglycan transglycosylase [Proteobacteria bacterium]|nr:monofunctional biosynthetic peptidoglycan transglycosylase [Pseudomonadota bacterium]
MGLGAIWRGLKSFCRWFWDGRAGKRTPWIRRGFAVLLGLFLVLPVTLLLVFRFVPVPVTPQVVIGFVSGDDVHYAWREWGDISPYLGRAVIGAEDEKFCTHHGFDWEAIDKVWKSHERHPKRRMRGASTISQQAARSLFATSTRNWVRKGVEAYETVLMEFLWPKRRILTVYLNTVDWGHGNYGAEAASQAYFGKPASDLTQTEAARLAAILPNPDKWKAVKPGPYVARRTGKLAGHIYQVRRDGLDWCVQD